MNKALHYLAIVIVFGVVTVTQAGDSYNSYRNDYQDSNNNSSTQRNVTNFGSTTNSTDSKSNQISGGAQVAQLPQCVEDGQTCVIGGTPCCNSAATCRGKFPNTTCQ